MELRHLRYFVAVAQAQSFTKAATRLRLAQPALSRQVADLEDELGVDLLKRTSHGATLTAEGRLYLKEAQAILAQVESSGLKVRALARGEVGELQVGYVPPLELHILPRALAEFQKAAPGVTVVLHDRGTDELCDDLREGRLNLALMMEPSDESISGISFEEIGRYPFWVAMAPTHPLTRTKSISVASASELPLVVLNRKRNSEFHRILKRVFTPHRPNVSIESDSMNSLITEVSIGRCVAVVSQLFKEAVGSKLAYRRLAGVTEVRGSHAIYVSKPIEVANVIHQAAEAAL
ncbi:MAG TPA: LysR substrate-binding domain-containing protein [Opitutaceae bacterium]|jgi:DNA-binding transcriptional LysR family regulator